MNAQPGTAPGDELVPAANMVFDRTATFHSHPEAIWPWLVQLGKSRAGWYLPARVERLLPPSRRAARVIELRWQSIGIGDRVPDYGGRDEYLEVARLERPRALVYRSERRAAQFSWALLLTPLTSGQTELRLRFRGRLRSRGWRRRAVVAGGDQFDWSTGALMLQGLRERLDADDPGGAFK